jgi:hypothetical protein
VLPRQIGLERQRSGKSAPGVRRIIQGRHPRLRPSQSEGGALALGPDDPREDEGSKWSKNEAKKDDSVRLAASVKETMGQLMNTHFQQEFQHPGQHQYPQFIR